MFDIRLNINYREIGINKKSLFLCETPHGITFNLCFENNPVIKIWSFIGTLPIDRAGTKYEYKNKNNSYPVSGVEITAEGDLNFYMTDILDYNEITCKDKIQNLITKYLDNHFKRRDRK